MLTRLRIRNFKRIKDADIELGQAVVLIGPNNSGKTTALQALALWGIALRKWSERRKGAPSDEKEVGVAINRLDLVAIPVPDASLLWRNLTVHGNPPGNERKKSAQMRTRVIRIELAAQGVTDARNWSCGFEFDYANEESLYCRPLPPGPENDRGTAPIPEEVADLRVAYLPPMSGLAAVEPKWEPGRINVLIGEGQTAQVLRNLCHQIHSDPQHPEKWDTLTAEVRRLFGVKLLPPQFIPERGEITMRYEEASGIRLDLTASGRGLHQLLLLLTHLYANPGTVLLLDEPDAHLEVLRQRQIYNLLTEVASSQGSQVIVASHSEIVLNEAADRDVVIAFVGSPHRINDRGSQVLKALRDIGYEQYYQAEQTGWILFLENASDLAILQAFAKSLNHEAQRYLERPFVHYVATNLPQRARDHFFGLREAKPDLVGIAIFDRLEKNLRGGTALTEMMWQRREIENYLCVQEVLLKYSRGEQSNLFDTAEADRREDVMREVVEEVSAALRTLGKPDPWSPDIKATDEFLDPVFREFFKRLNLPLELRKSDYHRLAPLVPKERIDPEVTEKLDAIVDVARKAKPREE